MNARCPEFLRNEYGPLLADHWAKNGATDGTPAKLTEMDRESTEMAFSV